MSIIKEKLRQQAVEFISLRETLELLTKEGKGCSIHEAALFLYQLNGNRDFPRWRVSRLCGTAEANRDFSIPLLDLIVKRGGLDFSCDDFYSLSDCDEYGFIRSELIQFISNKGIRISEKSDVAPEWAKLLKAVQRFTLDQAASVLVGLDPMDQQWPGHDGQRELEKAFTALAQAAEDGYLLPTSNDKYDRPLFRAQDLRAWAASAGLEWCIPPLYKPAADSRTATNPEAAERLRQLEADNARLVEQVAELQRQLQEATAAPQQAPQPEASAPGKRWPWGDHHTDALGHLEAAGLRHWQWFDPSDHSTAPTNETVIGWLKSERKVSDNLARAMATILRADKLPHGPRR